MITIWGTCRPVAEAYRIMQYNAVASWRRLSDDVILFGCEEGIDSLAKRTGCRHIENVDLTQWHTPALGGLFKQADELAKYDLLASVCCDMIMLPDLLDATKVVSSRFERFLMIGLKFLLAETPDLSFEEGWETNIRCAKGKMHKKTGGSDWFVYPRGLFSNVEFPRLVRGRYRDDIFLITTALAMGIPVIDCTDAVMALHQPHAKYPRQGPQVERNVAATRHLKKKAVRHAIWELDKNLELRRKKDG